MVKYSFLVFLLSFIFSFTIQAQSSFDLTTFVRWAHLPLSESSFDKAYFSLRFVKRKKSKNYHVYCSLDQKISDKTSSSVLKKKKCNGTHSKAYISHRVSNLTPGQHTLYLLIKDKNNSQSKILLSHKWTVKEQSQSSVCEMGSIHQKRAGRRDYYLQPQKNMIYKCRINKLNKNGIVKRKGSFRSCARLTKTRKSVDGIYSFEVMCLSYKKRSLKRSLKKIGSFSDFFTVNSDFKIPKAKTMTYASPASNPQASTQTSCDFSHTRPTRGGGFEFTIPTEGDSRYQCRYRRKLHTSSNEGYAFFEKESYKNCSSIQKPNTLRDGNYILDLKCTDSFNDVSYNSYEFFRDTRPAIIKFSSTPPLRTSSREATFNVQLGWYTLDRVSSQECRLNEEPFKTCDLRPQYFNLPSKTHTFSYRVVSKAGLETVKSYTWEVEAPADRIIELTQTPSQIQITEETSEFSWNINTPSGKKLTSVFLISREEFRNGRTQNLQVGIRSTNNFQIKDLPTGKYAFFLFANFKDLQTDQKSQERLSYYWSVKRPTQIDISTPLTLSFVEVPAPPFKSSGQVSWFYNKKYTQSYCSLNPISSEVSVIFSRKVACTTPTVFEYQNAREGQNKLYILSIDSSRRELVSTYTWGEETSNDILTFTESTQSATSVAQTPLFTWDSESPPGYQLNRYEVALGSTSEGHDISNWSDVGRVKSYKIQDLELIPDTPYYFSVRAVDTGGRISNIISQSFNVSPTNIRFADHPIHRWHIPSLESSPADNDPGKAKIILTFLGPDFTESLRNEFLNKFFHTGTYSIFKTTPFQKTEDRFLIFHQHLPTITSRSSLSRASTLSKENGYDVSVVLYSPDPPSFPAGGTASRRTGAMNIGFITDLSLAPKSFFLDSFSHIFTHELGHAFGHLYDEYKPNPLITSSPLPIVNDLNCGDINNEINPWLGIDDYHGEIFNDSCNRQSYILDTARSNQCILPVVSTDETQINCMENLMRSLDFGGAFSLASQLEDYQWSSAWGAVNRYYLSEKLSDFAGNVNQRTLENFYIVNEGQRLIIQLDSNYEVGSVQMSINSSSFHQENMTRSSVYKNRFTYDFPSPNTLSDGAHNISFRVLKSDTTEISLSNEVLNRIHVQNSKISYNWRGWSISPEASNNHNTTPTISHNSLTLNDNDVVKVYLDPGCLKEVGQTNVSSQSARVNLNLSEYFPVAGTHDFFFYFYARSFQSGLSSSPCTSLDLSFKYDPIKPYPNLELLTQDNTIEFSCGGIRVENKGVQGVLHDECTYAYEITQNQAPEPSLSGREFISLENNKLDLSTLNLPEMGDYYIYVKAKDKAGNEGDVNSLSFEFIDGDMTQNSDPAESFFSKRGLASLENNKPDLSNVVFPETETCYIHTDAKKKFRNCRALGFINSLSFNFTSGEITQSSDSEEYFFTSRGLTSLEKK